MIIVRALTCKWCRRELTLLEKDGTECNRCWEVRRSVQSDPQTVLRILSETSLPERVPAGNWMKSLGFDLSSLQLNAESVCNLLVLYNTIPEHLEIKIDTVSQGYHWAVRSKDVLLASGNSLFQTRRQAEIDALFWIRLSTPNRDCSVLIL